MEGTEVADEELQMVRLGCLGTGLRTHLISSNPTFLDKHQLPAGNLGAQRKDNV